MYGLLNFVIRMHVEVLAHKDSSYSVDTDLRATREMVLSF